MQHHEQSIRTGSSASNQHRCVFVVGDQKRGTSHTVHHHTQKNCSPYLIQESSMLQHRQLSQVGAIQRRTEREKIDGEFSMKTL